MEKTKRILTVLFLAALFISALCIPALAITESEVEAQVAASGKGSVTGNVLIWFLCAVAFVKVSQKIDSVLASLGINVGRTGGSMLAEAMIAMRTVTMVMGGKHGAGGGRASTPSGGAGKSGSSGTAGFFKGGLIGMAGRYITNSAAKTATTQTSSVHTAKNQTAQAAASAASSQRDSCTNLNSEVHTGGSSDQTKPGTPTGTPPHEGVIVTGGADPQAAPVESTPPVSSTPTGTPPQEGTILTGSEGLSSIPQADPAPQTADMTGASADLTPSQEGVIITEGGTTVHAPQSENLFSGGTDGTVHMDHTSASGGEHPSQTHTERNSQTSHTAASSQRVQTNRFSAAGTSRPTLGGMVFSRSLAAGGSFANDVIGTVARGEVNGSITGDLAAQSLASYMGHASPNVGSREAPAYSDVEIGQGRITGVETPPGTSEGQAFAMYYTGQYTAPSGEYTKVISADGTQWYKQYAQDAVERKTYMAPDDTVAYHERIIKKLPDLPKRKDRM